MSTVNFFHYAETSKSEKQLQRRILSEESFSNDTEILKELLLFYKLDSILGDIDNCLEKKTNVYEFVVKFNYTLRKSNCTFDFAALEAYLTASDSSISNLFLAKDLDLLVSDLPSKFLLKEVFSTLAINDRYLIGQITEKTFLGRLRKTKENLMVYKT